VSEMKRLYELTVKQYVMKKEVVWARKAIM
jgi:hypothetical protein